MPKAPTNSRPLSCLFAINKPTGQISMQLLNKLQPLLASSPLFKDPNAAGEQSGGGKKRGNGKRRGGGRVKLGQGGTLDPLADGVLVLATNNATKQLARFLDCTKEYKAIGFLGCSTDSYDSEGRRVKVTSTEGIDAEKIEAVLGQFRGEIDQIPPLYSALKMDGKPLHEYARSGTPLPRPIPSRKVTVSSLILSSFTEGTGHTYEYPKESLGLKERLELERLMKMVQEGSTVLPEEAVVEEEVPLKEDEPIAPRAPIFEICMTVSSGTYVRTIIHDIGVALGSSAHVVKLTRTRQGEFALNSPTSASTEDATPSTSTLSAEEVLIVDSVVDSASVLPVESVAEDLVQAEAAVPAITAELEHVATEISPEVVVEEKIEVEVEMKDTKKIEVEELAPFVGGCIEWEVLEKALKELNGEERDESDKMLPWEIELLKRCKVV